MVHPWVIHLRLEKYFLRGIFVGKKRYFGEILGYFCKKSAILRRNNYDNLWLISVLVNFYGLYIFLFSNPKRKKSKIWKTINFRRKLQFFYQRAFPQQSLITAILSLTVPERDFFTGTGLYHYPCWKSSDFDKNWWLLKSIKS